MWNVLPESQVWWEGLREQGLRGWQRKGSRVPDLVPAAPQTMSPSSYQVPLIALVRMAPATLQIWLRDTQGALSRCGPLTVKRITESPIRRALAVGWHGALGERLAYRGLPVERVLEPGVSGLRLGRNDAWGLSLWRLRSKAPGQLVVGIGHVPGKWRRWNKNRETSGPNCLVG